MRSLGLPQAVLAAASGYSERRMASIMSGETKYLKPATHNAIMAIGLSAIEGAERGKISSEPSKKLIEEILEAGYSQGWICRQLGFQRSNNLDLYPTITAAKANKIKKLHDQLWIENQPGQKVKCGNGTPIYGKPFREACTCYGLSDLERKRESDRIRQRDFRAKNTDEALYA
jgi:hypothetical protein